MTSKGAMTRAQAIAVVVIIIVAVIGGAAWFYGTLPRPTPTPTPTPTITPTTTPSPTPTPTPTPTPSATLVEWKPDGIIEENEYANRLELAGGNIVVYWGNDDEYLYMALKGQTNGWVSIGFEPSTRMKDADMIFGWVKDEDATVLDLYSTGSTGPHPPDTELGGTSDILEHGGKEENGHTIIEFKRMLDTGDEYDKTFTRGQTIKITWSMATVDEFATKHNIAKGRGELTLD